MIKIMWVNCTKWDIEQVSKRGGLPITRPVGKQRKRNCFARNGDAIGSLTFGCPLVSGKADYRQNETGESKRTSFGILCSNGFSMGFAAGLFLQNLSWQNKPSPNQVALRSWAENLFSCTYWKIVWDFDVSEISRAGFSRDLDFIAKHDKLIQW